MNKVIFVPSESPLTDLSPLAIRRLKRERCHRHPLYITASPPSPLRELFRERSFLARRDNVVVRGAHVPSRCLGISPEDRWRLLFARDRDPLLLRPRDPRGTAKGASLYLVAADA